MSATGERARFQRLQLAAIVEGLTLVLLVVVAVPLKHAAGYALATSIMGPIHGVAFLVYIGVVIDTAVGGPWKKGEIARLVIAAFVPFGSFANLGFLHRKEAALQASSTAGADHN